ncbi:uncharacterized protein LOC123553179 [Mercenaria mercenaria]|uniref:uncharacterized protein LOC123553179 n=1 Tax=Mercenaria mercenaria TaxID=6596 RepID=UPI00234EEA66|nr:uncharacterized protein LOC123553179 [Mercenaria mercenaria]
MTDSDNSYLSDSLHSLFKNCDEKAAENGTNIEYRHAPIFTPSGNESTSDCEDENPYVEFTKVNDDPNEGMVIVQMDDGGPKMRRRKPTEIVIPIDHVSSSDSQADSEEMADSSNTSSSIGGKSSMEYDGHSSTEETTDGRFQTKPTRASSCTASDNCESDSSDSDYGENMEEVSDHGSDETESDTDDEETGGNTSERDVSGTTPGSSRSITDCVRIGLSNASYLNICQKVKNGTAKLEEIVDARDRLGRHFLQTRPNHPFSNYIALRMFSSLSANYKFRNIGYVNLPARPNSANHGSVLNQQVFGVGDTVEISHVKGTSVVPADETPTEDESTSPVCSTRFDFTPAARSKIEGAVTACSEAANGAHSVESGRENPQAKQDSEVRPNIQILKMPTVCLHGRRPRQVLPPIPKATGEAKLQSNMGCQDKRDVLTKSKQSTSLKSASRQMKSECHTRNTKPGIPYQLRSVACYQDGKVDVSIMGDKRLLPEAEPLNVNITFIHRPIIQPNKEVKIADAADDKNQAAAKHRPFPISKKNISPALPQKGTKQAAGVPAFSKRPLPPLRNIPRTDNSTSEQFRNFSTRSIASRQICKIPNRKILPPVRNIPGTMKKDVQTTIRKTTEFLNRKQNKKSIRKQNNLNWDIVNDRAQWPPFNTHINAEASERHQKIFADISV